MNRLLRTLLFAAIALSVSTGFAAASTGVAVGDSAPAFELEDQSGKVVRLADLTGKVVVLEWVNPDCPFVKRHAEAGTMRDLSARYADKGVVWLAINSTHYMSSEDSAKYRSASKLPYQILSDSSGAVGKAYGAKTTPHMYIIDVAGKIVYIGGIDDDPRGGKGQDATNFVAGALDDLLAGKPVSVSQTKPYGCSVKYAK